MFIFFLQASATLSYLSFSCQHHPHCGVNLINTVWAGDRVRIRITARVRVSVRTRIIIVARVRVRAFASVRAR